MEDFKECTIGSLIVSAALAIIVTIIVSISDPEAIGAGIGSGFFYFITSLVLFGFLMMSRNMMEQHGGMFILGTIVVTAGAWWLGHGLAFVLVKINEGVYHLLPFKK